MWCVRQRALYRSAVANAADKGLRRIPIQPPPLSSSRAHTVLSDFRAELRARALLRPDGLGTYVRILVWTPALIGLLWVAWTSSSLLLAGLAIFGASILQAQFAFIGHDASHGTAALRRGRNLFAGEWGMGVVGGLCFEEWRHRHLLHHKYCQDEDQDPDMQFATLFSLSDEAVLAKGRLGRRIAPYQAYYFWPSTLLFAHSLRVSALVEALSKPMRYRADLAAVTAHVAMWFGAPLLLGLDPMRVLIVYLIISSLLGVRLAAVFTVNHVGMPSVSPETSYLERQVVTSRNVDCPRWMDWFFGGLNFQIEHHVLPGCSRVRLRQVQHLFRPCVVAEGLPYSHSGWLQAVVDVTRHLAAVARTARKPDRSRSALTRTG